MVACSVLDRTCRSVDADDMPFFVPHNTKSVSLFMAEDDIKNNRKRYKKIHFEYDPIKKTIFTGLEINNWSSDSMSSGWA